jgi:ABC-type sugar transport system ATPase subunit
LANLSLRKISKRFGSAQLFRDFDLEVRDGEFLCLLGPSGSGKTTLLRIIAGLEDIDGGDIFLSGREISRLQPRDRRIGMMFQGYALYPHMSVRQNLAYPLRVRHAPRREIPERVESVARLLGIEPLLDRYVQSISGGEQQRVAIGRAIVQKPDLYLLDEPISNLDASLREAVRSEIRRLQRELGATMIMVTHDQLDALAIADRIAVLRSGRVQQLGDPEDLYQNPANAFVAGFIGQSRMNLLRCRSVGGESPVLQGEGFSFPAPTLPQDSLGHELLVGFRPEAATVHRQPARGGEASTIESVQFQGDRLICMLRLGSQTIHVSFDSRAPIRVGEAVWLNVAPDRLHVFGPTGKRLSGRATLAGDAAALVE